MPPQSIPGRRETWPIVLLEFFSSSSNSLVAVYSLENAFATVSYRPAMGFRGWLPLFHSVFPSLIPPTSFFVCFSLL